MREPTKVEKTLLSKKSFDALMFALHPNRDEAARLYNELCQFLTKFLLGKGCPPIFVEECVIETLTRAEQKIQSGEKIEIGLKPYSRGIANNVLRELLRTLRTSPLPMDTLSTTSNLIIDPNKVEIEHDKKQREEILLKCMEQCLKSLPESDREFFLDYYSDENEKRSDNREKIAMKLNMKQNTLSQKVNRLRRKLTDCILKCAENK